MYKLLSQYNLYQQYNSHFMPQLFNTLNSPAVDRTVIILYHKISSFKTNP